MAYTVIWVQFFMVAMPTLWLALGALENIRAPSANGTMVADALAMRPMREEFPDLYAALGRNRIESPTVHRWAFIAIVASETLVTLVMLAGTAALLLAGMGTLDIEFARILAVIGMLGFTLIWSAFLVGGQWVHYWAGSEGAQHTHFMLTIWGSAVLCLLLL